MKAKKTKLPIEFNLLRVDGETASVVQCHALHTESHCFDKCLGIDGNSIAYTYIE